MARYQGPYAATDGMIGRTFGKLTVRTGEPQDARGNFRWRCQCTCGNFQVVRAANLLSGRTTSCGCSRKGRAGRPRKVVAQPSVAIPDKKVNGSSL